MSMVEVILNIKAVRASAYREFLEKVVPLLERYSSMGNTWNLGYGYTDYSGCSVDAGVWTYPGFSRFTDFDYERKTVSFILLDSYDKHGSRGMPSEYVLSQIRKGNVFDLFFAFAKEVAEVTGYKITVQKPIWHYLIQ